MSGRRICLQSSAGSDDCYRGHSVRPNHGWGTSSTIILPCHCCHVLFALITSTRFPVDNKSPTAPRRCISAVKAHRQSRCAGSSQPHPLKRSRPKVADHGDQQVSYSSGSSIRLQWLTVSSSYAVLVPWKHHVVARLSPWPAAAFF